MSQTDKLISIVYEHKNLLGFLNENHPQVLNEWKSKMAGLTGSGTFRADTTNNSSNHAGNEDYDTTT